VTTAALPAAAVTTAITVPINAGVTTSHRVRVGRRHGMLGMFCIDSGIIL
jgi:hypothetical protein